MAEHGHSSISVNMHSHNNCYNQGFWLLIEHGCCAHGEAIVFTLAHSRCAKYYQAIKKPNVALARV
eukprot:1140215-Pelagomonas_calceolata.AAC.3